MDFFIFRHGETPNNSRRIWQGRTGNLDLNMKGIQQAQYLGFALQRKNIEVVVSSPMLRAMHTANIVATYCNIPVLIREDLQEADYGIVDGKSFADVAQLFPDLYQKWINPSPKYFSFGFKKGETMQMVLNRVFRVLNELSQSHRHESIAISTHGGVMALMLAYFGVRDHWVNNGEYIHVRRNSNGEYRLY